MKNNQRGSVTLIVAVTILFILIILSASLMFVSIKRKAQLQESQLLQNVYGGNLGEIYQEQIKAKTLSASDITPDLYGKYVDIGLDTNDNGDVDDWEIFYVNEDRIFLIAADYVPVSKLKSWGVIGSGTILDTNGFIEYNEYYNDHHDYDGDLFPYSVC